MRERRETPNTGSSDGGGSSAMREISAATSRHLSSVICVTYKVSPPRKHAQPSFFVQFNVAGAATALKETLQVTSHCVSHPGRSCELGLGYATLQSRGPPRTYLGKCHLTVSTCLDINFPCLADQRFPRRSGHWANLQQEKEVRHTQMLTLKTLKQECCRLGPESLTAGDA